MEIHFFTFVKVTYFLMFLLKLYQTLQTKLTNLLKYNIY